MTNQDLQKIGLIVDEKIKAALKPIQDQLNDPETGLAAVNRVLSDPETGLKALNTKIDNITAELSEVHELASGTYDLVKLESQKRRQEINEVREHVGLSRIPIEL